jgi:putative transposase
MRNTIGVQDGTYTDMRSRFGLPAQLACSVPRQAGATYTTRWTTVQANAAARAAGHTKQRYKGLDAAPRFVSPTRTSPLGHDYRCTTGQRVSILSLEGRVSVPYSGSDRHVARIQQGAQIGAATRWYDQPRKQFSLLASLEVEPASLTLETHQRIVGVDVGQRYLVVATETVNRMQFFPGRAVHAQANHSAQLRKRLQHKGTRAAPRRLVVLAERESRLKPDRNHIISRRLVATYPHSLIGLEDLTHIRERTRRKRGKRASQTQRRANRHASQWAFSELHGYMAYKVLLVGSKAMRLDASHTSQCCPRCGYTSPDNHPEKGAVHLSGVPPGPLCEPGWGQERGPQNAARPEGLGEDGRLVEPPDVSNDEAKPCGGNATRRCGGVQTQAPCFIAGGI